MESNQENHPAIPLPIPIPIPIPPSEPLEQHENLNSMSNHPQLSSSSPSSSPFSSNHLKHLIEGFAEGLPVTIIMSLFTIWALFSDDIRLAAAPKEADSAFVIIITIAFFLFLTELIAQCYYKEGYLGLPSFKSVPNETYSDKL